MQTLKEDNDDAISILEQEWYSNPRWKGIVRDYSAKDVVKLRTTIEIKHSLAEAGSKTLWESLHHKPYVGTFGAVTGSQASQMVKAGLKSIYVSGWQVAADANIAGQTYPDQSLYPSSSGPDFVKRINNALIRRDQIDRVAGISETNWFAPIVADAEAGFGGTIHAFELMSRMIEAGAAGVHFEDQLAAEKKCGHMGGKVVIPSSQFIHRLKAARLAADVMNVPSIIIARTDALDASLLTSDVDMLWFETSEPNLEEAREFADRIHKEFPGKFLAYNCSPSFNWKKHMSNDSIARFQSDLNEMGYKFQFITLAGWHMININAFDLASAYLHEGMTAYVELQEKEFTREKDGYTAVKHQNEAGAGFFDEILTTVSGGETATAAMSGSTEVTQFAD